MGEPEGPEPDLKAQNEALRKELAAKEKLLSAEQARSRLRGCFPVAFVLNLWHIACWVPSRVWWLLTSFFGWLERRRKRRRFLSLLTRPSGATTEEAHRKQLEKLLRKRSEESRRLRAQLRRYQLVERFTRRAFSWLTVGPSLTASTDAFKEALQKQGFSPLPEGALVNGPVVGWLEEVKGALDSEEAPTEESFRRSLQQHLGLALGAKAFASLPVAQVLAKLRELPVTETAGWLEQQTRESWNRFPLEESIDVAAAAFARAVRVSVLGLAGLGASVGVVVWQIQAEQAESRASRRAALYRTLYDTQPCPGSPSESQPSDNTETSPKQPTTSLCPKADPRSRAEALFSLYDIESSLWLRWRDALGFSRGDGGRLDLTKVRLDEAPLARRTLGWANLRWANLRWADLSGADLREANLTEANLRWANLRWADLSEAGLSGANLSGANLRETNLRWADLEGVSLSGADLSGTNLREANLRWANLKRANLSGADLSGADLREANLIEANFYGANLRRANLFRADLRWSDLEGVDLTETNLRAVSLFGADLRKANLTRAGLSGSDLSGANLTEANLRGISLSGASLYGTNLREANLTRADLRWSDLEGADLREADLSGANLEGVSLRGANLRWADLRETNLFGSDLSGANLTKADLRRANLTSARRLSDDPPIPGWDHVEGRLQSSRR